MYTPSDFAVLGENAGVLFIMDLTLGGMSVTNDAERVYEWCQYHHGHGVGIRIVYRDSEGEWSEMSRNKEHYNIDFLPWDGLEWDILKRA